MEQKGAAPYRQKSNTGEIALGKEIIFSASAFALPMKDEERYSIIYADPPWNYADKGCQGTMANHYRGMTVEDLSALSVGEIAAPDSILFLWATWPMLKEALSVIESWGFNYRTIGFVWVKQNKKSDSLFYGLGRWTRGNTEPCLLATRGKPKRISRAVYQIIFHPRGKHSQKPPEIRQKIVELIGDLPRIELFARDRTMGWDAWGNEVESDVRLAPLAAQEVLI